MKSEPGPSMFSTMKSPEPQSTQYQQHDPSMYSTVNLQKRRMQQGKQRGKKSAKQQTTYHPVEPTMKYEPEPSFYPSESHHPAQSEPSSPQSTQEAMKEPSIYPTVSNGDVPQMYATFYFEFSLFDEIESIHSVELERELSEELAGIWVTDPAVVCDEDDKAVGITFNGEIQFDADYNVQFAPGTPMGAVVLDKVAELLKEDMSDSEEENENKNTMIMNRANIVSEKKVFEINEYVPMMMVCAAVGTAVIVGAKLYLAQFKGKEYEPLLG